MRKLIFDYVSIEITRRCNLKCRHCLRGDAQDVDIDLRTIDALVEQTAKIYNLSFTGGEPTLNVSAIAYTLDALRGHKVPLHSIEVATNGKVLSSEFVKTVKEFSRYIAETGASGTDVSVGISKDRYHQGADPDVALDFYQRELAGVAAVKFMRRGDVPVAIGRGRGLADAMPPPFQGSIPHQIETLEAGKPCGCKERNLWPTPQEGEKIVCCRLNLSAHGDLALCSNHEGEYAAEDGHHSLVICNLSPNTTSEDRDIDRGILEYNKRFPSCLEAIAQEGNIQTAEYVNHPRRAIDDFRRAYQLMQLDPSAKAQLIAQCPGLEEQFEMFLGVLDIVECFPDEYLAEVVKRNFELLGGSYVVFEDG